MNDEIIINDYINSDITCKQLAIKYGLSYYKLLKLLKFNSIKIDKSRICRKYSLNQDYFDIIDTEDKAYFLGLMYSDGYNDTDKYYCHLHLKFIDKNILERFKKCIGTNKPLNYYNRSKNSSPSYKIIICSKKISQQLQKLGCFQNKSLTLKFPTDEQIPNYLLIHFIRGYFDGDGSLGKYFSSSSKRFFTICSMTSTLSFCKSFSCLLKEELGINTSINIRKNGITTSITINGDKQIEKFLDYIYSDSSFYLERKYKKYIQIKDYYKNKKDLRKRN